jgi:hypothetical protein
VRFHMIITFSWMDSDKLWRKVHSLGAGMHMQGTPEKGAGSAGWYAHRWRGKGLVAIDQNRALKKKT